VRMGLLVEGVYLGALADVVRDEGVQVRGVAPVQYEGEAMSSSVVPEVRRPGDPTGPYSP